MHSYNLILEEFLYHLCFLNTKPAKVDTLCTFMLSERNVKKLMAAFQKEKCQKLTYE